VVLLVSYSPARLAEKRAELLAYGRRYSAARAASRRRRGLCVQCGAPARVKGGRVMSRCEGCSLQNKLKICGA